MQLKLSAHAERTPAHRDSVPTVRRALRPPSGASSSAHAVLPPGEL